MENTFYAVGVGCGDPENLTLKAVKTLERCDIIVAPKTSHGTAALDIVSKVIDLSNKQIVPVNFKMTKDKAELQKQYDTIADEVAELLKIGDAAMVTIGDVTLYSTAFYIFERLKNRGFNCKIIEGVPSICSCAALAEISLCEGDEAVHILPGSLVNRESLSLSGTKIIMKSARKFDENLALIKEMKLGEKAILVADCGAENEAVYVGADTFPSDAGYFNVTIIKD